jgi:long-chain acyl-CoA synthetase
MKPWQAQYDREVPLSIDYPPITMYEFFLEAVKNNPGGKAVWFFGKSITYRALHKQINRFSARLAALGVQKGDRVALILPNIPAYPIAHFAVLRLGGILVPTNPLYVERELEFQLNDSGAETAIVFDKLYLRLAAVQTKTKVKRIVVTGVADFLPQPLAFLYKLKNKSTVRTDVSKNLWTWPDFIKTNAETPPAALKPDDTALFLYTGGTTGVSKGAVLTHHNIVVNVIQTRKWLWGMRDREERIMCVLPFFHSYGMTTGLHLSVAVQSTMLLLPRFELKDVMKTIRKTKPTVFCGVPSMYNAICHFPGVSGKDVGSIRLCVSGGSALPVEVQHKFEALSGGKLVEGYGLSETSPVTHVNPLFGERREASIGLPVSDTDAMIVDPDTRKPMPVGEVGELALRGPQVMKGYWNRPDETDLAMKDGWFFTGDLAVMDEKGFFKIVDRKKDLIISAGVNIYPREIEEVLHQHPKIMEAAVLGVPSKVRDERVMAVVVVKPGETLTKEEVFQFCKDKLAKFKTPKIIEFRDSLPKSTVGKVLKRVIRDGVAQK